VKVTIANRPAQIEFDPGQPKAFIITDNDLSRNLDLRASRVQMGMRFRVRVRTGKLLSSIRKNRGANASTQYVDILAGGRQAPYVLIEEDGSRPHVIVARRRKFLRIPVGGGRVVFRRRVYHPGTTGTHFMTRSLPLAAAD
jgi:hypothetical protein